MSIRRDVWNTYITTGYTYDVAHANGCGGSRPSAGGVHHHQIRRLRGGQWQERIVQSNGRFEAIGPAWKITATEGEKQFAQARKLEA